MLTFMCTDGIDPQQWYVQPVHMMRTLLSGDTLDVTFPEPVQAKSQVTS